MLDATIPQEVAATLRHDLPGGYRLEVENARMEDGAFVGDAAIYNGQTEPLYDNFITLDARGIGGFLEDLTAEAVALAPLLEPVDAALSEWARDPARALAGLPPAELNIPLTGGATIAARNIRIDPDGVLHAALTKRNKAGIADTIIEDLAFDGGRAEYVARDTLNLAQEYWVPIREEVRALVSVSTPYSAETETNVPMRRIVRAGDLALEELRWLVADTLPAGTLALLVGKEATYKSFVALDIAAAVLNGREWAERPVEQGSVLYLAAEGQSGLRRRIRAWEIVHRADLGDLLILPYAVNFLDRNEAATLEAEVAALDPQPALIVVDTLARNMPGDENAQKDMGAFVAALDRLRRSTGGTVLVIHHENKLGGYRGSTALVAAMDCVIAAKRTDETVTLTAEKMKDGAEFAPVHLSAHVVELGMVDRYARPVTSLVLRPTQAPATTERPLSPNERIVFNALRDTGEEGLTATEWQTTAALSGISRPTFYRLRADLEGRGCITRDGEGKSARYRAMSIGLVSVSNGSRETGLAD